jgi:hypothetical protein
MDDPAHYYLSDVNDKNDVWVMGDEGLDISEINNSIENLEYLKEHRGSVMILNHPKADINDGKHQNTLQIITSLAYNTTIVDGLYFSTISDYARYLEYAKTVSIHDNSIVVSSGVPSGLTVLNTPTPIVIDGKATMILRQNKTMLPALSTGTYNIVYTNEYPTITDYTNGSLLTECYYDIDTDVINFTIHDDDQLYNDTSVIFDNVDSSGYGVYKSGSFDRILYLNGSDTINNLTEGVYTVSKLPLTVAYTDPVDISITHWNTTGDYSKLWTESSESHDMHTTHVIGDFLPNRLITINRNNTYYATAQSNDTGYINWTYTGGYSNQTFEAADRFAQITVQSQGAHVNITENSDALSVTSSDGYTAMGGLLESITGSITSGISIASLVIIIIAVLGILRYLNYI